jgi:WD repeat-containing protein 23
MASIYKDGIMDRDQRSLGRYAKPSGVFVGHTQGITFITSKQDGRYCLSNAKDQTMKMWDIRKMSTDPEEWRQDYRLDFDYRMERYPLKKPRTHPYDQSVLTMMGHSVLRTLIRCHFSPCQFGNRRYAYTGSADGHVYIYDTQHQGQLIKKLSIASALDHLSSPLETRRRPYFSYFDTGHVTRDVSWHPYFPLMVNE